MRPSSAAAPIAARQQRRNSSVTTTSKTAKMMRTIGRILLFVLLLSPILPTSVWASARCEKGLEEEEFSEGLLLRPLPDKKVLSHFHFQSSAPASDANGRHHHIFPKAVAQLVKKFHIREMELSFTQGRWSYERWGASDSMASTNAKPPGVELWAVFDVPIGQVDLTWKGLTHALSGLFCSSINFLDSSTSYTSPHWGFNANLSNARYGALPREAVCTENLTPWFKLLPCRDKAGIASLLDRPSIYKGYYHSQRMRLISSDSEGIVVEQSLTAVLDANVWRPNQIYGNQSLMPSWSISSLFRKKLTERCALAKSSDIFLELEQGLVAELEKFGPEDSWRNLVFVLSVDPDRVIKGLNKLASQSGSLIYKFNNLKYRDNEPLDVGIEWKLPLDWSCSKAPFQVTRFLMGSGNERGSIAVSLQSMQFHNIYEGVKDDCRVKVVAFQIVPWYVKVYYHTLQIFIDGQTQNIYDVVEKIQVQPSEDKVSPGTLELMLKLPCGLKSAVFTLDFDKGFLHIDEYPPDANQGFDIPSAIVSFPDFHASPNFVEENSVEKVPLLLELQERNIIRCYTEVLLVPLTTPDFSMPYNVITFTCTVLALYFGSLLNVLRRRVAEEERLLMQDATNKGLIPQLLSKLSSKFSREKAESEPSTSKSSVISPKMLLKVILVAMAAVAWHYFLNDD